MTFGHMKIRIPRSRTPDDLGADAEPFASDDMSKLSTRQGQVVEDAQGARRKSVTHHA
jgi:hypothetical protein